MFQPPPEAAPPLVRAEDLRVSLEGTPILHGLDFALARGAWVGVLGPNGSGKTTLLRTLGGLLPYDGTLSLEGRAVRDWKPQALARRLAFVRQFTSLAFDFRVDEFVLLGRAPHKGWLGGFTAHDRALLHDALRRVDLEGFEARSVTALSGGEQQRVLLAQALVQEADLLLLDEPTAHLDVHYQFEFMNLVRDLVDGGRTVLAVFHDLELAARYADALLVLHRGQVAAFGPPAEVITERLIADVFRMRARLAPTNDGLRIEYLQPTA